MAELLASQEPRSPYLQYSFLNSGSQGTGMWLPSAPPLSQGARGADIRQDGSGGFCSTEGAGDCRDRLEWGTGLALTGRGGVPASHSPLSKSTCLAGGGL